MPPDTSTDELAAKLRSDAIALSEVARHPSPQMHELRRPGPRRFMPLLAGSAAVVAVVTAMFLSDSPTRSSAIESPAAPPLFASLAQFTTAGPPKRLIDDALLPAEEDLENEVAQIASDIEKIRSQLQSGWSRLSERSLKG